MGWSEKLVIALVVAAAGFYAVMGIAIVVTALIERRPLKFLVPADPDDPLSRRLDVIISGAGASTSDGRDFNPYASSATHPYWETQVMTASRLGFSISRLFKNSQGGIYQNNAVLMVSPSRQILAVVRFGTTAKLRNEGTALYSALADGRYLVTWDRPSGGRTPGLYDGYMFYRADFAECVARHEERLNAAGNPPGHFSAETPLADYEAILARRASFLIENGQAYWVDPEHTAFRSTVKGALAMWLMTFDTKHIDRGAVAAHGMKNR